MADRRHLRPVGDNERVGENAGSMPTVIEDLEVAHGHIIEATAEAAECDGQVDELVDTLIVAEAAVQKALREAHAVGHPSGEQP